MNLTRTLNIVAMVLVLIGALNWGMIAVFQWNFIAAMFGQGAPLSHIAYLLFGLGALYALSLLPRVTGRQSRSLQ